MRADIFKVILSTLTVSILIFIGNTFGNDIHNLFINSPNYFWSLILNIILGIWFYYLKYKLKHAESNRDYYQRESELMERRNHELWSKLNNKLNRKRTK